MIPISNRIFKSIEGQDKDFGTYTTEVTQIGILSVPSGKIVACDPLVFPEQEPFSLEVKPGQYPVYLNIVHFNPEHQRVAYAILRFNSNLPVRWKMATLQGKDVNTLKENEIFGYGVDAGTGCFMDAEAAKILAGREDGHEFYEQVIEPVYDEWADIPLNEDGLNMILFRSGWGDGFYASYWGFDENDEVACLVTDFAVLDEE
ncbi:MAG: DUF4241 domain-containing protein [Thermoactinomyces sp.]|jgi:hypothetical protein